MEKRVKIDRVRGHSFIATLIAPGSSVVDLGMNEGKFSTEMQQRYQCRIFGVEANPALAQKLLAKNFACLNVAIANEQGKIEFFVDPHNSEASSLTPIEGSAAQPVEVSAIRLEDLFTKNHIHKIDLLKIDIEGAEIDLLMNVDPTLLRAIKQICIEFHIFLFPDHKPLIEVILKRMHDLGFYAIDFSRNWEDVLFVNQQSVSLSQLDRLAIGAQKYQLGVGRMVRRMANILSSSSS